MARSSCTLLLLAGLACAHAPGDAEPPTLAYACADGFVFVARTSPDAVDLYLPDRMEVLPRVSSASGARYELAGMHFWSKGDEARLETRGVERSCALDPAQAPWEAARLRGAAFRAVGNEPGWNLELQPDGRMRFVTDYGGTDLRSEGAEAAIDAATGRRSYRAQAGDHEIQVTILEEACRDDMSGAAYPFRVRVVLDGREHSGCGRALGSPAAGRWQLARFGEPDAPALADAAPTLDLDAWGRATGSSGCNRFSGGYRSEVRPDLSFTPLATTRRACPGAQSAQEQRYLEALGSVQAYQLRQGELRLADQDGRVVLVFSSVP